MENMVQALITQFNGCMSFKKVTFSNLLERLVQHTSQKCDFIFLKFWYFFKFIPVSQPEKIHTVSAQELIIKDKTNFVTQAE